MRGWVCRPDITISGAGGRAADAALRLQAKGLHVGSGIVYKDRRAGDMINYIQRYNVATAEAVRQVHSLAPFSEAGSSAELITFLTW